MTNAGPLYSGSRVRSFGIPKVGRYSCKCGRWMVLPLTCTKENPFICRGPGNGIECEIKHYWENGKIVGKDW